MRVYQIFLISVTCILYCTCQCDLAKFEEYKIAPDRVNMPKKALKVTLGNESFECGTNTGYMRSMKPPTVKYDADDSKMYTLIMVDEDVPFPVINVCIPFLHWLVVNIPGSKVEDGKTAATYLPPGAPPFSGAHRYVLMVFEQNGKINSTDEYQLKRLNFKVNDYVKSHNLQGPEGGYFFLVGFSMMDVLKKIFP